MQAASASLVQYVGPTKLVAPSLTLFDALALAYLASAHCSTRAESRTATWRTARGPIAVAALELQRLGWTRSTLFEYADHDGTLYSLVDSSPITMRHPLHLATLHRLATQLTYALGPFCVIYEPDARLLLTRSLTPPQKGIVAGVFAGTVWPRDRPRNAGYDAECELRGPDLGHSDSLHHRPHPTAVAARALAACPDGTLDAARTADFSDPNCVFTLADASLTRRLGRARGALRKRFSCWPTTTALSAPLR